MGSVAAAANLNPGSRFPVSRAIQLIRESRAIQTIRVIWLSQEIRVI